MRISRLTLIPASVAAFVLPFAASAQVRILPPCTATGNCDISDILGVIVNIAEFLLSIMGAVALAMFILGGFFWVFSGGEPKMVQKGKDTIRNAVIGIALILFSGVIVRFTGQALTGGKSRVPLVGESCNEAETGKLCETEKCPKGQTCNAQKKCVKAGIYVSVPPGVAQDGVTLIKEGLVCIKKDDDGENCKGINDEFEKRGRGRPFSCLSINTPNLVGCVRGLCGGGADSACCIRANPQ